MLNSPFFVYFINFLLRMIMELKVFGIYDSKTEAYLQPFFAKTKGDALRSITSLVNDSQHNFSKFSADFTLFELGSFDDSNASFNLHHTPYSLGVFIEFKKDND